MTNNTFYNEDIYILIDGQFQLDILVICKPISRSECWLCFWPKQIT